MKRPLAVACVALTAGLGACLWAAEPTDNPVAAFYKDRAPAWVNELKWANVFNVATCPGDSPDEKLKKAQEAVVAKGGGVVFFPAGTYAFKDHVLLQNGVVIRGETPAGVQDARDEKYDPPTKFEFPQYKPVFDGQGTPNETAFKGVRLADPVGGKQAGLVNVALNHAHIELGASKDFTANAEAGKCGRELLVFGCVVRNAAILDSSIPMLKVPRTERDFQQPWQRWSHRHHAAIDVYSGANVFIANNRVPASGEDNFTMKGYKLVPNSADGQCWKTPDKVQILERDVLFDFDNRPGISVNYMALSKGLAVWDPFLEAATPEAAPKVTDLKPSVAGLAQGIVIRDNYVFCTGCTGIRSTGDGTLLAHNVIRYRKGVALVTARGYQLDHFTNNNRAIEVRGWRWTMEGNDYEIYSNVTPDGKPYGDGEGLMHEAYDNVGILDSKFIGNKGNAYLCVWRVPIDGLLIQGNEVPMIDVRSQTRGKKVVNLPCRKVQIIGNTVTGQAHHSHPIAGIFLNGGPITDCVIKDNINKAGKGSVVASPGVAVSGNQGFEEKK